jgi:hypothetical protein
MNADITNDRRLSRPCPNPWCGAAIADATSDNGSELTSNAFLTWADHTRVAWHLYGAIIVKLDSRFFPISLFDWRPSPRPDLG